ncbi:MAG: hypothetical protein R2702_19800 [Acidimicrobiales bacterium]
MTPFLRGALVALALLALLVPQPAAAAEPPIALQPYAIWPPDYCSQAKGDWSLVSSTGPIVSVTVTTYSRRAPSGVCDTASTAGAGVFAAWAKVEHYSGGSWSVCAYAPWTPNSAGTFFVQSIDTTLDLCGTGLYRLRSENRITYGGSNQYSPPFLSSSTWL